MILFKVVMKTTSGGFENKKLGDYYELQDCSRQFL